jgi:hypothetical protein
MRIGRKVIVSVIVSLSAAGSIFATSAIATTAAQASTTTATVHASPNVYMHG